MRKRFLKILPDNGIPTSEANAVLATSDGFIWIGGYSGLIKYDGTNFVRQDSSTGVTSVNTLFEDNKGRGHSYRVAKYTSMLAKELGYDEETVDKYNNIALLHDIGKIGVPPEVLNKAGKLTDEEFDTIKSHTTLGYNALKDISIMPELAIGAEYHHERPDGKGYPEGLKGDKIPRVAQIIAVAWWTHS